MKKQLIILILMAAWAGARAQSRMPENVSTAGGWYNASDGNFYSVGIDASALGTTYHTTNDGNFIRAGFPFEAVYLPVVFDPFVKSSKGYYPDYVELAWEIHNLEDRIDRFRIYRKPVGSPADSILVATIGGEQRIWQDQFAQGNVLYKYTIQADGISDARVPGITYVEALGFRVPFGIITGHIEYEGGVAVEGVRVTAQSSSSTLGASLYFDGDDYGTVRNVPALRGASGQVAVEAWVALDASHMGDADLFSLTEGTGGYGLSYEAGKLAFWLNGGSQKVVNSSAEDLVPGSFVHVCGSYDGDTLALFVNGERVAYELFPGVAIGHVEQNLSVAARREGVNLSRYFKGHLDELRVWDRARSPLEVKRDFSRYLGQDEPGLVAYWRVNENFGHYTYDFSRGAYDFNRNDLRLYGASWTNTFFPTFEQLGFAGVTDKDGDYIISNIAYRGTGENFLITPSLGVHSFRPGNRTLYIGNSSSILNGIDFTDISSFRVTGTVRYENSSCYAKDVFLQVDGQIVVRDGLPVRTDANGFFDMNVPIGHHKVSVYMPGHQFENPTFPPVGTFDFQEPLSGLEFIDVTRYTVIGRVVGGTVESSKKLGFDLSVNNIGQAELKFVTEQGGGCYEEYALTDPASGEYEISLPPMRYIVSDRNGAYAPLLNNPSATFTPFNVLDLSLNLPEQTDTSHIWQEQVATVEINGNTRLADVTTPSVRQQGIPVVMDDQGNASFHFQDQLYRFYVGQEPYSEFQEIMRVRTGIDTVRYHAVSSYVYRNQPELLVMGKDGQPLIGDRVLRFMDSDSPVSFDLVNNPFAYPIFSKHNRYEVKMEVLESFTNYDQVPPVVSSEHVRGARIVWINNLASNPAREFVISGGDTVVGFTAGSPNFLANSITPAHSYTKAMEVTAISGSQVSTWLPNPTDGGFFRGYVLGTQLMEGMDFVSEGPQVVSHILRDPPGSGSYTSWEQGTTKSTSYSTSFTGGLSGQLQKQIALGTKFTLGLGMSTPTELENTLTFTAKSSIKVGHTTGFTKEETANVAIQTDANPELVGSASDLFIGQSLNFIFGLSDELRLLNPIEAMNPNVPTLGTFNNGYTIGVVPSFEGAIAPDSTHFVYSQDHIENYLIPQIVELRNAQLFGNPHYTVHFTDADDPRFGTCNDDPLWGAQRQKTLWPSAETSDNPLYNDYTGPSYTYAPGMPGFSGTWARDEVRHYNQQIRLWREALARNEQEKVEANQFDKNHSFDAGPTLTYSTASTTTDSRVLKASIDLSLEAKLKLGGKVGGTGVEVEQSLEISFNMESEIGTSTSTTTSTAYTLNDPDQGDYFTINVYRPPHSSDGPIFRLMGGRSMCPYEGEEEPRYYVNKDFKITDSNLPEILDLISRYVMTQAVWDATMMPLYNKPWWDSVLGGMLNNNYATPGAFRDAIKERAELFEGFFQDEEGEWKNSKVYYPDLVRVQDICELVAGYALGDSPVLSQGTIQREVPTLAVEPAEVFDVPDNAAAFYNLQLGNRSGSGDVMWYQIRAVDNTNPDGALLTVDGEVLLTPLTFEVPAGQTVVKTLSIQMTRPDVFDYDSIGIMIFSPCDWAFHTNGRPFTIGDTVWVSAHFVPSCTDVELRAPLDQFLVNYNSQNDEGEYFVGSMISGYDANNATLERIQLQYKPTSQSTWIGLQNWWKDPVGILPGSPDLPLLGSQLPFSWNVSQLVDGQYNLRAMSYCSSAESGSEPLIGKFDRVNPRAFGSPQPASGILTPDDEIMITFNEPIFEGGLTFSNFDIRGILNGTELAHGASIHFDGTGSNYMVVPDGVNLVDKPFSIEIWARREGTGKQTLVAQGSTEQTGLWFGFDTDGRLMFQLAGQSMKTSIDPTAGDPSPVWHHYVVTYDKVNGVTQLFVDGSMLRNEVLTSDYEDFGRLLVGRSTFGEPFPFLGNAHELRVWTSTLTISKIVVNMNLLLSGLEKGLVGNWRMDEARGSLVQDYASSRTATLIDPSSWAVEPGGDAYAFDGVNDFLEMDAFDLAFTGEQDFTLEFWFKADAPGAQTFLSNGAGTAADQNALGWTIASDAAGQIWVHSGGKSFKAADAGAFDGAWHHFALVMNRRTVLTSYLDGALRYTSPAGEWGDFGGSKLYAGARMNYGASSYFQDQFLNGMMDEIRVWNLAKKADQILANINSRQTTDMPGLLAYLPFESYQVVMGVPILTPSIADASATPHMVQSFGGAFFAGQSPAIKLTRPVSKVNFEWVSNGDRIVLMLNDPPSRIENCILDITVQNVRDLNGNRMQSPVTWSVYVKMNQVTWKEERFVIEKPLYEPYTFMATIQNSSGQYQNFTVGNLPPWLTASPSSGTLAPLTTRPVTFTISPGINTGYYSEELYLTTDFGFDEKLALSVRVFDQEPDWTVDGSAFQYSMNIIGNVRINGVFSTDRYDRLAAFVGDECRGVAYLDYIAAYDQYQVFMPIFSNQLSGEHLTFKVWDASQATVHEGVVPELDFEANGVLGTPAAPIVFDATDRVLQSVSLARGWNWVSFNLDAPELADLNQVFAPLAPQQGDIIKSANAYDQFVPNLGWMGTISATGGLQTEQMYKLRLSSADTLSYAGQVLDPRQVSIPVVPGWNWIGFVPRVNINLSEAMALAPLSTGNVIKSQNAFAIFDANIGWIGSLKFLQPGKGYMLSLSQSGAFTYPEFGVNGKALADTAQFACPGYQPTDYQYNMSVLAVVEMPDQQQLGENYWIQGWTENGCQALGEPVYSETQGRMLYFLTVSGNTQGERFHFQAVHNETGATIAFSQTLDFVADGQVGDLDAPFVFTPENAVTAVEDLDGLPFQARCFPNPFSDELTLSLYSPVRQDVQVVVTNALGQIFMQSRESVFGNALVRLPTQLAPGVYWVRVLNATESFAIPVVKVD